MKSVTTLTMLRMSFQLFLVITLVQNTIQQCLTKDDSRLLSSQTGQQSLYNAQQDFSLTLLRKLNKLSSTNDNIFFSPYSTFHALLLAYFASAGQTEQYLINALRLNPNENKANLMYAYRLDKLHRGMISSAPDRSYEFNSVNKMYVSTKVSVRNCMVDLFNEEIEKIDFESNLSTALQTINGWVQSQTQEKIRDLIPPDGIDQNTNLMLVNAAFFKGIWKYQFNRTETRKGVFYTSQSQSIIVTMMTQEGTFNHDISEVLGCHILEMPYKDSTASMYIFLPPFASAKGIDNVLEKLTAQAFGDLVKKGGLYPKKVIVTFPRFALERSIELAPVLENMGVGDPFTKSSDLSRLTSARNVSLGRAIHKAKIEVTEEGTKDAAPTPFFTFLSSKPSEPTQFVCNYPFIYIIYDKQNKVILFSGIFRGLT